VFTARQREIIDASIRLIARKGIQEVTMKNLSREVGISEPALYRHFKNKHDILAGVLESFNHYNKLIPESVLDMDATALEKLKIAVVRVLEKFAEYPEISGVFFSEEIFQNDEDLAGKVSELISRNREFFIGIIDEGISEGSLRDDINKDDMSLIIIGVMRLLVIRWRLSHYSFDLVAAGRNIFEGSISILFRKQLVMVNNN